MTRQPATPRWKRTNFQARVYRLSTFMQYRGWGKERGVIWMRRKRLYDEWVKEIEGRLG